MISVTLYTKKNCAKCEEVVNHLRSLQSSIPHKLVEIDIDKDLVLMQSYNAYVPVVDVGPYHLQGEISRLQLEVSLRAARDRVDQLEAAGDEDYQRRSMQARKFTGADAFTYWFSRHYMLVFNLFVLFYVGLPFLAPVLLKAGVNLPARIIYTIYSPLCHQLGFRSWFLFGEQPAYPRSLAGVEGLETFTQATGIAENDIQSARRFLGDEHVGYKVALCERDVAIYGSILIFGLIFSAARQRIRAIPWYMWVLMGLIPIGIDGVSQLPGLMNPSSFDWLPIRESTPLLRTLTGFVFGFATAWYGYPHVEETMRETRLLMERKRAFVNQNISNN